MDTGPEGYGSHCPCVSRVEVRGPVGRFKYTKNAYKKMGFVAGGTGLTPCLQVKQSTSN